jgi:hypothetical protein
MPTESGSISIDSANFATAVVGGNFSSSSLVFASGGFVEMGPFTSAEVAPYVTGYDLSKGVGLALSDWAVPGFGDASIVNGTGADLIVWEAGAPAESFQLAVSTDGGVTFSSYQSFTTTVTNPLNATSGYNTNVGYVDLSLFGLAADAKVDAVKIAGLDTGIGGSGPDILAVGILNAGSPTGNVPGTTVPEPGILLLLGAGVPVFIGARRWFRR